MVDVFEPGDFQGDSFGASLANIVIMVAGVDITADVIFADASFIAMVNGSVGSCSFRVKDTERTRSFTTGEEIVLSIDGIRHWGGYLLTPKRSFAFDVDDTSNISRVARILTFVGVDYNILFKKRVVRDKANPANVTLRSWLAGTRDDTIIKYVFDNYTDLPDDGFTYHGVEHIGFPNPDKKGVVGSAGLYFGDLMAEVNRLISGVWYFTPDKDLVFTDVDVPTSDYYLTDTPGTVVTYSGSVVWRDLGIVTGAWAPLTAYAEGDLISVSNSLPLFMCATPGTTDAVEPDWPDIGGTGIDDGTVTWQAFITWESLVSLGPGNEIQPLTPNGHRYISESYGVTGAAEPTWPTTGGTVQDGDGDPGGPPVLTRDPLAVGYREFSHTEAGANLANDAFVWGAAQGAKKLVFARTTDTDSRDLHGLWQYGEYTTQMYKQTSVDQRADSIVYGTPQSKRGRTYDQVSWMATTFQPVFRVGQKVTIESVVHNISDVVPIRQMKITFPTKGHPRFDMVLSHEIDEPWNIFEFLWPMIDINIPIPRYPGPVDPGPLVTCGITDTFNRADTDYSDDALGTADCGRDWTSYQNSITGFRGRALGFFHEDMPVAVADVIGGTMPGPWPVPFMGSIVVTDADSEPGFSHVSGSEGHPVGRAWARNPLGDETVFNGSQAIISASPGYLEAGDLSGGSGPVFSPYQPVAIAGHLSVVEVADPAGLAVDNYIAVTLLLGAATAGIQHVDLHRAILDFGAAEIDFPDDFWNDIGEADFSIEYTGGFGGDMTVTVGPNSWTETGLFGAGWSEPSFRIQNGSTATGGATVAHVYLEDPLTFNGKTVDSAFVWQWKLNGADVDNNTLKYTFTYVTLGGGGGADERIGYPTGYETGVVDWADAGGQYPDVMGPMISVRIEDEANNSSVIVWFELGSDLAFPFTPVVEIDSLGATLTIGATSIRAVAADAVDVTTGAPTPIGLLLSLNGFLRQAIENGQGTFVEYDDLNITGVNACTEGLIEGAAPLPVGTEACESPFFVALVNEYKTSRAFLAGSLMVWVGGLRLPFAGYTVTGPSTFELTTPAGSATVYCCYRASGI